ncbi:MAG TPA: kelch repeat-containing protein, partial [Minicystis sp.]|nr:kelch repeat-containing protein [Minicystis sp.]
MSPLHGLSRPARARAAFCLLLLAGAACAPDTEPANGAARGGVGDADRASAGGASPGGDAAEAGARLAAVRRRFPAALPEAAAVRLTTGPGGLDVAAPTAALPGEARVRVTLPLSARGRVELDDARSDVAVTFALVAAGGEAPADAKVAVAAGTAVYAGALGGGDLLHRASAAGTEDLAYFRRRPARAELRYDVDVERVAGLHLLGDVLELVDARGIPRLRVDRPFVVGADGRRLRARLDVSGCAVDRASGPAWRRAPTAPGASHCELVVSWPGVAYPALVDPEWTTTANQMQPRQDHTATLLPNGDVLLAGGFDASGAALDSAEVFCAPENCGIGVFGQTVPGSLVVARGGHTATLVDAGHVLLVGGKSSSGAATGLQSAELYDVAAETFSVTATSPAAPRAEHTATLLGDGRVLIVGGLGQSTAEIYDPASGFVQPTIPLGALRYGHVAELEGNSGKVLVAGGIGGLGFALSSATLFDPATNTFTPSAGNMTSVRAFAAAARLEDADGSVLITGGRNEAGVTFETAEIYDPTTDEFKPQLIQMQSKRAFHTATTLLGQGRVLLTGGDDGTGARLPNTEVFDLLSPSAFTLASQMNYGRAHHAATLLASGQVLVTGGDDPALPNHYGEVLLRQNGEPCAVGTECASGVCTTKGAVCCDKPCDDNICEACFHGDGDPNNGSCLALAPGTPTTAGCQDAIEFQLVCDGNGGITPGDIHACGAYACTAGTPQNPARCRTDADGCATDADCSADGFCNAQHKCADKQDDGSTCEGDNASQCKHGHCVDGRCCDAACDGQCEACDVPGFGGTCTQVTGAPHGSRKPCDATGTKCEGTCKSNPTACDYAPVACGDSVCKDGKVTGGVCGMGPGGVWTCTEGSKACGDYTCAPDGKDCRTDCQATTTDCAPGRICTVDGQCAVVADTKCDEDHTLVNPDGTSVDCTPFKCRGTACIDRCKTVDDCVSPSVCDDQGRCTAAPAAPA